MLKKTIVLAMAVGLMAAVGLPGVAAASWKHHKTAISTDTQIGLTGKIRTEGKLGGVECQITMRVKLTAGTTTGHAETFVPHPTDSTADCKGLGGYAGCQVHSLTPQAPNWLIHTAPWQTTQLVNHQTSQTTVGGTQHTTAITITTQSITYEATGAFCVGGPMIVHKSPTTIGATCTTQCETLTGLDLNGIAQVQLTTNNGAGATHAEDTQISGHFDVESPNQNTYSI